MTFTELVTEVLQRTRQTSTEAQTRIGRAVNDRYRRVTSSIGLNTARRTNEIAGVVDGTVVFNAEKVYAVWDQTNKRILAEVTLDQFRTLTVPSRPVGNPEVYAILSMGADKLNIGVTPVPPNLPVTTLNADVLAPATALAGTDLPTFAADFHDILMHGALADEWLQLKQNDLSRQSENSYEGRLSELRMFIAKSAYLTITQGASVEMTLGRHTLRPYGWYS